MEEDIILYGDTDIRKKNNSVKQLRNMSDDIIARSWRFNRKQISTTTALTIE